MSRLDKIKIVHSLLSDRILLARFGKDQTCALETKDAMNEFLQAVTSYAFDGKMPEKGASAEFDFGGGDEQFICTVTRK